MERRESEPLQQPLLADGLGGGDVESRGVGDDSSGGGGALAGGGALGTTLFQTCFNILNIFVGTGLQSMPYALRKGGWAALAVQAALIPIFALSGQLICSAFDLLPSSVPKTYPELGRAAAGRAGHRAVLLFSFLELFGGSIVLLMVCWQMLELLLPPHGLGSLRPMQASAAMSTACLLPLLFVDLRRMSRLSLLGLASSGMVVALSLSLLLLDPHRAAMPQQPPPGHHWASAGMIQAAGIFALSSTCHSTLPALRIAMQRPCRFPVALGASFSAMMLAYSSLAAAGYWYWGDSASPLVTTDLAINSYFTGCGLPIHRILAAFVLLNCLTKYPALNLVLQDMILSVMPLYRDEYGEFHPPLHWVVRALRLGILAAGVLLALTAYDVLGSTLSLLGGLGSITCSLLLPTAFYALLAWRELGVAPRSGLVALLVLGCALVVLITATNLQEVLHS